MFEEIKMVLAFGVLIVLYRIRIESTTVNLNIENNVDINLDRASKINIKKEVIKK